MINKSLLLAALTGVALTGTAFAFPTTDAATPAKLPAPRPIASSVVQPTKLPREFAGTLVNIEFSLDQSGQPQNIKLLSVSDPVLKRQVVQAFSQWRFSPGASDATASAKRFILPLEIQPDV